MNRKKFHDFMKNDRVVGGHPKMIDSLYDLMNGIDQPFNVGDRVIVDKKRHKNKTGTVVSDVVGLWWVKLDDVKTKTGSNVETRCSQQEITLIGE